MKKILIMGLGVIGSSIAKILQKEKLVEQIFCFDKDKDILEELSKTLSKVTIVNIDINNIENISEHAKKTDLIINALPPLYSANVLKAALRAKTNYQDLTCPTSLDKDWVNNYKILFEEYAPKFKKINKLAIVGTGSAPGLICVITREACRHLDTCHTIYNLAYEGVRTKTFLPFLWSPKTALHDMTQDGYAVIEGELVRTPAFKLPIKRKYSYIDNEIEFVEHCHDEVIQYYFNKDSFFKEAKNIYFKYAGVGIDFAKPLYQSGKLSEKKQLIDKTNNNLISPNDIVLNSLPTPPKTIEEIQNIIDTGLIEDSGCMVAEVYGEKNNKYICVEIHIMTLSFIECFERYNMTSEMFLTGNGACLFTKLFLNEELNQTGLITSDMLTNHQNTTYLKYAKDTGINYKVIIKELNKEEFLIHTQGELHER